MSFLQCPKSSAFEAELWGQWRNDKPKAKVAPFNRLLIIGRNGQGAGMYYSWDLGPVHFVAMNSESALDTPRFDPAQPVAFWDEPSLPYFKVHHPF